MARFLLVGICCSSVMVKESYGVQYGFWAATKPQNRIGVMWSAGATRHAQSKEAWVSMMH